MGCKGCSKRQDHKLNVYDWLCVKTDFSSLPLSSIKKIFLFCRCVISLFHVNLQGNSMMTKYEYRSKGSNNC